MYNKGMQKQINRNLEDLKISSINLDFKKVEMKKVTEYKTEEVGAHSVKCKNPNMCFLPKTYKYVKATDLNGEETRRRIAIHKVTAHTLLTPIS